MWKFGDKVFHVANPAVMGVVISNPESEDSSVIVEFEEEVCFSGNQDRGYQTRWGCNPKLLFTSAQEALAAHVPAHKRSLK